MPDDNSLLSAIPTNALVAELKKRDGVVMFDEYEIRPFLILVVREDE